MSNSTSQTLLQCPSRLARVSFRLVDEHGCGKPYAGLTYRITDRQGLDCSATLDEDGYAQVDNVHGGPLVVSFPNGYVGSDPWYRGLLNREHFPIPLSALQVAAEQSSAGPRHTDGKTYLAQERAAKEDAYFIRAEVSDFIESKSHLPTPDQDRTTLSALKQNAGAAKDQPGVALGCEQTLIVCGHSLGGAIALLLAEWLRREWSSDVQLYTFGAPRAADAAFVKAAQSLTHHRIVNHNDPVPALPLPWMDAEWKLALPGAALAYSSPVIGIALLLAGIVNLQGDSYEHHGQQWHFMPRKPGAGSEAAILWQPGCALISEQTCARAIGEIGLDGDMPNRVALTVTQHLGDSGYARSALTNLLRWNASVEERNGRLFTDAELRDIYTQVVSTAQLLESWQARSFNEFRWEVRRRGVMRFYGKTDLELRAIYADAVEQGERVRAEQSPALTRTQQRLLAQAERVVTLRSVFGEHAERPDLPELVAQWRAIENNQNAERLAAGKTQSAEAIA